MTLVLIDSLWLFVYYRPPSFRAADIFILLSQHFCYLDTKYCSSVSTVGVQKIMRSYLLVVIVAVLCLCLSFSSAFHGANARTTFPNSKARPDTPRRLLWINDTRKTAAFVDPFQIRGGAAAAASTTGLSSVAPWVQFCGVAAPVASVFLSLSSFPTIRNILKKKSVGDLPLLPYSSLVANASIWAAYGILKREIKLWPCNILGVVLGLYYFRSFVKYSPKTSTTLPGSVSQHVQAAATGMVGSLAVATILSREKAASILGKLGVGVCIALFASPLAALKTVIKKKSAESIPLPFAVATTVNCLFWFVSGVFDMKDINVWLPNGLGLLCGLLQISMKLVYGNGKEATEEV